MTLGAVAGLTGCDSQAGSTSKGEFIISICHTAGNTIAQSPNQTLKAETFKLKEYVRIWGA